jgi:peptide deformylase
MIRQTTQAFLSAIEPEPAKSDESTQVAEDLVVNPLTLVYFPNAILKQPCTPVGEVTEEIKQLARDMLLTMMLEGGVGLAAPQIGKLLRIFVVDVRWPESLERSDPHIFINPELVIPEGEEPALGPEGCLSFPGGRAKMSRYKTIKVKHLDGEGFPTETEATGFFARAIQHEMDHLDGKTIQGAISTLDMMTVRKNIQTKIRKHKREVRAPHNHKKNVRKRSR